MFDINRKSMDQIIGVGRFRILGGQGLEYWGGGGGEGVMASHRRHFDVMCPLGF